MRRMTMMSVALLFASLGMACWDDAEQIDQVRWSDDDSAQAYVKLLFEESSSNPLSGTSNKRNFEHQIFVQDGAGFRALTGVRSRQNGASFYYMRQAGYVLLDVLASSTSVRWDLIAMDGSARTIARWDETREPVPPCAFFEALPSWDGYTIALLERKTAGASPTDCANGTVEVEFYDVETESIVARYEWPMTGMLEATWTPDNELIVFNQVDGAWVVDPHSGPTTTALPTCFRPRTSSSSVSWDGHWIWPGPTNAPIQADSGASPHCWNPTP